MNDLTKQQRGSPARDHFKFMHKQKMNKDNWALDVDLELVEKHPFPFIVARLDYKQSSERLNITFTEALSYQYIAGVPTPLRIPVFIVEGYFFSPETDDKDHRFNVYELLSADYRPNPPTWKKQCVLSNATWEELAQWEKELRVQRKLEIAQTDAVLLADFLWNRFGENTCDTISAEWVKLASRKTLKPISKG
jgi:hypothetical protein